MSDEPLPDSEIILYQTEDGRTRLEVRLQDETVWLTQKLMAELFQTSVPNVSMHIRNVFAEGELQPDSVVKEFLTTAADGKSYTTQQRQAREKEDAMSLNESIVENAALEWFMEQCRVAPSLTPALSHGEREEDGEVVQFRFAQTLTRPLPQGEEMREALRRLNPFPHESHTLATLRDPAGAGLPKLLSGELSVAESRSIPPAPAVVAGTPDLNTHLQ